MQVRSLTEHSFSVITLDHVVLIISDLQFYIALCDYFIAYSCSAGSSHAGILFRLMSFDLKVKYYSVCP